MKLNKMNLLPIAVSSILALFSNSFACTEGFDHDGILPKNNLRVPTTFFRTFNTMSEETFDRIIGDVKKVYDPIVAQAGGTLEIEKDWKDDTVNAFATRSGTTFKVNMFGGLARHPDTTEDGLALVVCHEIGHHLGGFPKKNVMWGSTWASNEGQADYFATTKCLRNYFKSLHNSAQVVAMMTVSDKIQQDCFKTWGQTPDHAVCVRSTLAGQSMGNLFASLSRVSKPDVTTPDGHVVSRTNDDHPAAQCRLDTYFQGSLCNKSADEAFSQKDEFQGACTKLQGYDMGTRSTCWFKPATSMTPTSHSRIGSNGSRSRSRTRTNGDNGGNGTFQGGRYQDQEENSLALR